MQIKYNQLPKSIADYHDSKRVSKVEVFNAVGPECERYVVTMVSGLSTYWYRVRGAWRGLPSKTPTAKRG